MKGFTGEQAKRVQDKHQAGVVFLVDESLDKEGYEISFTNKLVVKGGSDRGLLSGVFACLQELQRGSAIENIPLSSAPYIPLRMLNHWDNMVIDPAMGSIERVGGGGKMCCVRIEPGGSTLSPHPYR